MEEWLKVYREVVGDLTPAQVGRIAHRTGNTARNWYAGRTIPHWLEWRRIVVDRARDSSWYALSAARDAAAATRKKPGAKREDPAAVLRRRISKRQAQLAQLEVPND